MERILRWQIWWEFEEGGESVWKKIHINFLLFASPTFFLFDASCNESVRRNDHVVLRPFYWGPQGWRRRSSSSSIFKYISLRWDLGSQRHRPVNGTPSLSRQQKSCANWPKSPHFFWNKLETKKNIIIHGFGILFNVNKILGTYGKENRETHFG